MFLIGVSLFCGVKTLAEELGDIPTDEFIQDALQVEVPEQAATTAEQNMAAEQVGEETINAGNNVLHTIKDSLQNFGDLIGENLEKITGGNPFITKILVALVLVVISVFVITILVLIAKKFVFKANKNANIKNNKKIKQNKKQVNAASEPETDDEYEEYEEEYTDTDENEFTDDTQNDTDNQFVNDDEYDDTYDDGYDEYDTSVPEPIQSAGLKSSAFLDNEPQTVQEAMGRFVIITE